MGAFPPVGRLAKPTGPTGNLSSSRKGMKAGGKRMTAKSGLACSPAKMAKGR